ncbi:MAG: hypothetical protein ACNA7W_15280 [Pseudomonadales bacterium]
MSRSGNHALINWMLAQAQGRSCFLNCTEPGHNPFTSARPQDDGAVCRANYADFDLQREQRGRFSSKDLLIYSHEDCFLGSLRKREAEAQHDLWLGRSRRRLDVLLLRDPFNLFASRLKAQLQPGNHATALRIWKQHAREFLGLGRHLGADRVVVSYNRWVRDHEYRRDLAELLELEFTDAGRLEVPQVASGSSFDGLKFHGRAADMAVTERWRWLDQFFCPSELFDAQTLELGERIFGRICSSAFRARILTSTLSSGAGAGAAAAEGAGLAS